ncbi:MAG: hypothetical protein U0234_04810 [Sandaracinus sp.]
MSRHALGSTACLAIAGHLLGCSLVLAPSRRHGDAQDAGVDATTSDSGPPRDTGPMPDTGPTPDTGPMPDTGAPDDAGTDAWVGIDAATPDAGPVCPSGLECQAAPAGWNGPLVVVTAAGAVAPACPASATRQEFVSHAGMVADPASCGCTCGAASAVGSCANSVEIRSTSVCNAAGGTTLATVGTGCTTLPNTGTKWTAIEPAYTPGGGSCPANPTTSVPPLTWASSYRGCAVTSPTACGPELVCAPMLGVGEQLCVWSSDTAMSCPPSYPNRIDVADGANDGRGCSACMCGSPVGRCSGNITLSQGCSGNYLGDLPIGGCIDRVVPPTGSVAASISTLTATATCTASSVGPTGLATPMGERVVCCR